MSAAATRGAPTWLAWAVLGLSGCALLGKSEPLVPRYFAPEATGPAAAVAAAAAKGLQLQLGRIEGGTYLRERLVVRRSAGELAYREDRRWTERPEVYLRRALARTLFEERGLVELHGGRAVTLDVELQAFEELEPERQARLQLRLVLRDERLTLLEETFTVEEPIAAGVGPASALAVVEALSRALHLGVARAADAVVARLALEASAPLGHR